jgi:hypothetical protein
LCGACGWDKYVRIENKEENAHEDMLRGLEKLKIASIHVVGDNF